MRGGLVFLLFFVPEPLPWRTLPASQLQPQAFFERYIIKVRVRVRVRVSFRFRVRVRVGVRIRVRIRVRARVRVVFCKIDALPVWLALVWVLSWWWLLRRWLCLRLLLFFLAPL